MALPVLDGNQSATTLSSVVTGGEHIVAHSVVSLGATAISNINSAVSGTAVTIPGLARLGNSIASDNTADANLDFIKIGGHQDGQNQVAHIVHVSAGGAMKVDASGSSVTFSQAPVTFGAITGSASILNFPSTQTVAGTVTANVLGYDPYNGTYRQLPVGLAGDGFVSNDNVVKALIGTEGGVVNISNPLPISGTVTASLSSANLNTVTVGIRGTVTVGNSVTIGSLPAISGTVTATIRNGEDAILNDAPSGYTVIRALSHWSDNVDNEIKNTSQSNPLPISGTVTAVLSPNTIFNDGGDRLNIGLGAVAGTDPANWLKVDGGSVPISGTVTAAAPNGSLTTRFGTPTTANTAFATAAVTKSDRKYLLIQNVTTGSNVITVGIGFTPTTTQGIQLTAGAGITFESSYIPTGAVYVLSSVTASNFTILEA